MSNTAAWLFAAGVALCLLGAVVVVLLVASWRSRKQERADAAQEILRRRQGRRDGYITGEVTK